MTIPREALLGPSYWHHIRLIQRSREWSPSEIEQYQRARLQKLIRRYGDKITDKVDYRIDLDRFTRYNMPLIMRTIRTGGTSAEPLRFRMDTVARRQKELAYIFNIWSTVGYAPFNLRVVYRGNADDRLCRFDSLQNRWVISARSTTRDRADLRRWARKLQPCFLHVYPSSLFTLIDLLGESLFRSLPIKGVLAGSESFPVGEMNRFERDFGIPVAHWYGHSECAALAYRCRTCMGFHFFPTYGHVELLKSNDNDLLRIVASSFNRVGTQFVRYDTGDLAEPPNHDCVDNFPLVGDIVGRSQERFIDETGMRRALGPYIFGIHGPFWDKIRDLQFVQERAGHIRVCLVTDTAADRSQIQKVLEQRLSMVRLDFDYVSHIDRLPNGKRKYFINKLNISTRDTICLHSTQVSMDAKSGYRGEDMCVSVDKGKAEQSINGNARRATLRRALKGITRRVLHPSDARIISSFPMFSPASAGSARDLAAAAIQAAEQVFPLLLDIASLDGKVPITAVPITAFANNPSKRLAAAKLKELYDYYGSDKASTHDYHLLYGSLLSEPTSVDTLLEIGLGTNNQQLISNMGKRGRPGGSLRAFRDFLPKAQIYGADIDRQILFQEDRISTFFVDQTDPASLTTLASLIGDHHFDLIIDDGLHSPNANLAVLDFGLSKLKVGGWLVVEDIRSEALPIWQLTGAIMPQQFEVNLVTARKAALFAVQRLA